MVHRSLRIIVTGVVQGVGFRPFVWRLARQHRMAGSITNAGGDVVIEASGTDADIEAFVAAVRTGPPLAVIRDLTVEPIDDCNASDFVIVPSRDERDSAIFLSPDIATCDACTAEFHDPASRYNRYPFVNCTDCGPRYSIIEGAPYDRAKTTMDEFAMCDDCRAEYTGIASRRYHAEPVSCPACGPRFTLAPIDGTHVETDDLFAEASRLIGGGAIIAVKGVGGYHLVADALSDDAVRLLRQRKHRDAKPFGLMARDMDTVRRWCEVAPEEERLLLSKERPIVLLKKKACEHDEASLKSAEGCLSPGADVTGWLGGEEEAPKAYKEVRRGADDEADNARRRQMLPAGIAPDSPYLGIMLPYAPFHHLLLERHPLLIFTSGNISGEPIVYRDDDIDRLAGLADYRLVHDRRIVRFVEDSVAKVVDGAPLLMRKSRGYAPTPLFLPRRSSRAVLALGADLKASIALLSGDALIQSQFLGDLEDYLAFEDYRRCVTDWLAMFRVEPDVLACDLHPAYFSTRFADEIAGGRSVVRVQHHEAHIAAVALEHGWFDKPVAGIALDGTGYGRDGAIWGGELFIGSIAQGFTRTGALSYLPFPFGDKAVKEPAKTALGYLVASGVADGELERLFGAQALSLKGYIAASPVRTSSTGRLFDAVSFLLGFAGRVSYEGQAAIALENMLYTLDAATLHSRDAYSCSFSNDGITRLDVPPMLHALLEDLRAGTQAPVAALRFHNWIVNGFCRIASDGALAVKASRIALSGGAFQNSYLLSRVATRLREAGFTVATNRFSPPNDACICIGQAALAGFGADRQ